MVIKGRGGEDIQIVASNEWGTESWIPAPGLARLSQSGLPITERTAYGVPAVFAVIRSAAELVSTMPFMTYQDKGEVRVQARNSWQWQMLHDKPNYETDPYQFFYDLNVSIEASQNAFVYKLKQQGRRRSKMIGVEIIDPQRVRVRRADDGTKLFDIMTGPYGSGEEVRGLTTDDILHIRGFSRCPGDIAGTSLLEIHADSIGNAAAMQKFEGDFFRNNAVPPLFFTGATSKQQAEDLIDLHNGGHRGVGNQWKVGALWGTADVKPIPLSMRDAMFIDAKNIAIEDICRIWHWPRMLMEVGEVREAAVEYNIADSHIMKIYVLPRLRRIEAAFNADEDFYFGTTLFGEFLTAAMEKADTHTRYDAYRLARQGGWVTANELRALENFAPLPGGNDLLQTPVGGAPNPAQMSPPDKPAPAAEISDNSPKQLEMWLPEMKMIEA